MNTRVILVPLDGSVLSEAALPYAEALAAAQHGDLRLFGVVESVTEGLFPYHLQPPGASDDSSRQTVEAELRRIAERLKGHANHVEVEAAVGVPTTEILRAADRNDVSTVVMATHGRGGAERWVIGSVADKVMRTSPKPVLLVRPRQDRSFPPVSFQRVLLPLDGSPEATLALQPATELALATGALLILIRVIPSLTSLVGWGAKYVSETREIEAEMAADARNELEQVREELPQGIRSEAIVLGGSPALALEQYINEHSVDLTIMATHGRGGFSRFVLGSTADRLVQAGAQILLIPRPHDARQSSSGEG